MLNNSDLVRVEGIVNKILPNLNFRVQLDSDKREILAYLSGKMRRFRIKVLIGDRVTMEMPSKDSNRGRIIYRRG